MAEEQPAGIGLVYLTLDDVLELYALTIGATAVEARDQLRNREGLEGALARPVTYAHYQDADLALQAAVLASRGGREADRRPATLMTGRRLRSRSSSTCRSGHKTRISPTPTPGVEVFTTGDLLDALRAQARAGSQSARQQTRV
jgi:hypothetical protein